MNPENWVEGIGSYGENKEPSVWELLFSGI